MSEPLHRLSDALRETQLGVEEAVRLTTEVADALDYAHRQGVVPFLSDPERTETLTAVLVQNWLSGLDRGR
ncbi:MAG: hypothetical protein R3314_00575 [Longimicrobiales bacterium]|nr:hypothetical protein [Longimicrobiales bacterium]